MTEPVPFAEGRLERKFQRLLGASALVMEVRAGAIVGPTRGSFRVQLARHVLIYLMLTDLGVKPPRVCQRLARDKSCLRRAQLTIAKYLAEKTPIPAGEDLGRPLQGAIAVAVANARPAPPEPASPPIQHTVVAASPRTVFTARPVHKPASLGLWARIVEALEDGPHTSMGLASRLGVKELVIGQELSLLMSKGEVSPDPVDEAKGARLRFWRLAVREPVNV